MDKPIFLANDRVTLTNRAVMELDETKQPMTFLRYVHGMARVRVDGHKTNRDYLPEFLEHLDDASFIEEQRREIPNVGDVVTIPGINWTFRGRLFVIVGTTQKNYYRLQFLYGPEQDQIIEAYAASELLILPDMTARLAQAK